MPSDVMLTILTERTYSSPNKTGIILSENDISIIIPGITISDKYFSVFELMDWRRKKSFLLKKRDKYGKVTPEIIIPK